MILDYNASTDLYILRVSRGEADPSVLMTEYGLDLSVTASNDREAVLFTGEPYAAATFGHVASTAARERLSYISERVALSWASSSTRHVDVPENQELWPFQVASVAYALDCPHALVADEPGLGKTPIAIAVANEMQATRVLVVCPAAIRFQWCRKIREWSTMGLTYKLPESVNSNVYAIISSKRGVDPAAAWTVISWDLVRSPGIWRALAAGQYDLLILDEAHYAKTYDARRTRAVFGGGREPVADALIDRSSKVLALTGTPLPNRPREAYVLARHLCVGAETRVLTSRGIVPIIAVSTSDLVWDGIEWVEHQGVVGNGERQILTADGLEATPDHQILSGQLWFPWSDVAGGQNESIRYQMLATGLESLLSLVSHSKKQFELLLDARAGLAHTRFLPRICDEAFIVVSFVSECLNSFLKEKNTKKSLLTQIIETVYLEKSGAQSPAAIIQSLSIMCRTAAAELQFIQNGEKIGENFLRILSPLTDGMIHLSRLIDETMTEDMSLEISDLPRPRLMREISARSYNSKQGSTSFKNVYDLLNAGPRHRFTIVTNSGFAIISNCWEAIDFASEDRFNERFNPQKRGSTEDGRVWVDERVGRTSELQNRLRANFMVRHLKRDVMTQLKMPVFDLIRVEETTAVKAALAAERLLDIDPEDLTGADAEILGHIASARKLMGVAMAPQVADYLRMLIEGGETKLVVFAWHIEVLDILCEKLAKYGTIRVDGRDGAKSKDRKVQQFIRERSAQIILGNVLSLGTGTDGLQFVSNHALLAEADWTHGNNVQCFDRLDRGGQREQVQGDIFVAPGSIAERVLASALRKAQITHKALDRRFVE